MVLNATNRAILERIYGGDTEDCIGNPIVMYVDENVSYAGKLVVIESGVVFEGQTFGSLSEVARHITGRRWNGPRFFGLRGVNVR